MDFSSLRDSFMILLVLGTPLFLGLICLFLLSLASKDKFHISLRIVLALLGIGILIAAIVIYLPAFFHFT